jgi:hypothetical protein
MDELPNPEPDWNEPSHQHKGRKNWTASETLRNALLNALELICSVSDYLKINCLISFCVAGSIWRLHKSSGG